MSLVEKAALHLERLKKAGEDVSGVVESPAAPSVAARAAAVPSTVERATERLHQLTTKEPEPQPVPAWVPDETVVPPDAFLLEPPAATDTEAAPFPARSPDAPVESPQPFVETPESPASPHKTIEIDYERLGKRGFLTPDAPQSRLANELRVVKRPLINNCKGKKGVRVDRGNRIMITSSLPGEGKSFVSLNLAMSIAMERDSTVLLVEADSIRPTLGPILGMKHGRGLMDILENPNLDIAEVLYRTSQPRLSFIPAGRRHSHATELLASAAMANLVEHLASRYSDRILIFDAPPLLAAPEPRVLAHHMGQIVFVAEAEKTSQSTIMEALATIEDCPVVLPLLNKSVAQEEGYGYYYYG